MERCNPKGRKGCGAQLLPGEPKGMCCKHGALNLSKKFRIFWQHFAKFRYF
jgi:hypothetical protein